MWLCKRANRYYFLEDDHLRNGSLDVKKEEWMRHEYVCMLWLSVLILSLFFGGLQFIFSQLLISSSTPAPVLSFPVWRQETYFPLAAPIDSHKDETHCDPFLISLEPNGSYRTSTLCQDIWRIQLLLQSDSQLLITHVEILVPQVLLSALNSPEEGFEEPDEEFNHYYPVHSPVMGFFFPILP